MIRVQPLTESSLIIYFGEGIDPVVSTRVRQARDAIQDRFAELVVDMVPSYHSLHITFCLSRVSGPVVGAEILRLLERLESTPVSDQAAQVFEVPVYYGPEVALDMDEVASRNDLSRSQVVEMHCAAPYRVYAIGFSPGFCYLGSIPQQLAMPRKATPRSSVPAGSVAIADRQTAIYPDQSPGGWQILGRTPMPMHPADARAPRLQVGDLVQFRSIDRQEYLEHGGSLG